ncbi:hypothetical protein ACJMK2_012050 [Sinanodonta woodiana]|uniref:Uncharacterized protein n=1 Tax=Sinanodonta woodiana TaxID=1069815 RepID=A0ABD3V6Z1_SINWO
MKLVALFLGLACLACAQDFPNLMGGMFMPHIPHGMKLDDLKDAFKNLPPGMKERIDAMANSFGMSINDVEEALNNPPEQMKQMFEQNTTKDPETAKDSAHRKSSEIPQIPEMSAMLGMLGIPSDASPEEIHKFALEKAKDMGFDLSNPEKLKETLNDQLKTVMPGVNLDELIQEPQKALHATLKGMGIPTDDPKAMKKMVQEGLKEMGIDNVDLDNMDDLVEKLKKKAFHMLDIDENEDPEVLKKRVKKHVVHQMHEMGIDAKEDDDLETVEKKVTTAISKELKRVGIEVESDNPQEMMRAIKKKINEMGIKFDNMQELQNKLMGMVMHHAQSAFMNMITPPSHDHNNPMMAPKTHQHMMPPHFIPQMQFPTLNLEIDINVEEMENQVRGQRRNLPYPSVKPCNNKGATKTLTENFGNVEDVVKQVRSGLRSGSMSEDVPEEMLDQLLHYRLKNTMLKEKLGRIRGRKHAVLNDPEMHKGGNSHILSVILEK